MSKNYLDGKSRRNLEDLVAAHKKEIEGGKWTQQAFAEYATRKLGRPYTAPNVAGAAKVMDIEFPRSKGPNGQAAHPSANCV